MLDHLKEVFASFDSHEVRYVVIGGVAAILHGVPRATFDLDILIEATPANAKRLLEALAEAGLGTSALTNEEDLLAHIITVFEDRIRIDVQTSTPGITFAEAWDRREEMKFAGQRFHVLRKEDVIATKLAAGRQVDLEDVRILQAGDKEPEKK